MPAGENTAAVTTSLPTAATAVTSVDARRSSSAEARALWQLRRRLLANTIAQLLRESRFRVLLVAGLTAFFWLGLFLLFADAFRFLVHSIPDFATREQTVRTLYNIFFLSLMVMLVFSTAIILYGSLFRSSDTQWLLTLPVRDERIFLYKFQEAMFFGNWGFLLLGSPMLVAYGLVSQAPWYYYALLPPFMGAFVYVPGSLGALACLFVVHWLPRRRRLISWLTVALVLGALAAVAWSMRHGSGANLMTSAWFRDIVARLEFSEQRLLPSWWLSTGLLEAAQGQWSEGLMLLLVTLANALLLHQVALVVAGRTLRRSFDAVRGYQPPRSRWDAAWLDRVLERLMKGLPHSARLLVMKDVRTFRRDPVQWSQFMIFFGLLGLYFANIRRLSYDLDQATWVNMVSFLNLAVVGLILSTFTSRFVFPMISLEGKRLWILGRLPIRRDAIIWSKFLFAMLGSIVPCALLVLLSDLMLRVVPLVLWLHLLICVLLATGLSGIAVGLGAMMPNLREESPTKIAAGFGGTLNLVVSTLYIAAVVGMTAVPCHFYLAAEQAESLSQMIDPQRLRAWITLGAVGATLLGALATAVPLWFGLRAFRRLEY